MRDPSSILISGASSGLGAALAVAYAKPGRHLFLGGRDDSRLAAVTEKAQGLGATVHAAQVDVTDRAAVRRWIEDSDTTRPLDLVIANAGISAGTAGLAGAEAETQVRAVFATNVDGVMNTALPAVERMEQRGRGQVALMASLAGYRGFPGAPSYCGSKAAVKVFGEGLRGAVHSKGVGVSVICPGYVRTPMTAVNDFPMPFLMDVDRAAQIIVRGLAKDRARIAFPWPLAAVVSLLQVLPAGLVDAVLRGLPAKRAAD